MFDDTFFEKPARRSQKDLNIVPILDMLVTIIFFLLSTAGFLEYTKLTVPPSATSVAAPTKTEPPLSPRMYLVQSGADLRLVFAWTGGRPGQKSATIAGQGEDRRKSLLEQAKRFSGDFLESHPGEKTVQLGLGPDVPYQDLVTLMDGVRDALPDMVLISYDDAVGRASGSGA